MQGAIRVLHVDDEEGFTDLAETFLEREDDRIEVEGVTDADAGLARLATDEFDCVVSDYDMPGTDGLGFLEAVREDYPDLPFILFTGKGSEAVASDAISAGVTDYLQKEGGTDQYAVLANRIANAVEHRRSERRLERSNRRLREIVDHLPHLLYVVDEDGTYLLANEALADFHDATVDDIEGSTVDEVLGDAAPPFYDDLRAVLDADEPQYIEPIELTDAAGERHVLEPQLLPYDLTDTGKRAVLGIAVDVTEYRASERELERYERLVESMDEEAVVLDTEGRYTFVTEGAAGPYDPGDWIGRSVTDLDRLDRVHDEDIAAHQESIEEILAGEREHATHAMSLPSPDGEVFLETRFSAARDDDGDLLGVVGIVRDVTARKERERKVEDLHATARALMTAETREEIARTAVDAARDVLGLPLSSVHLATGDGELVPVAYTDQLADLLGEVLSLSEGSLAWRTYQTGKRQLYADVSTAPDRINPDTEIRSEIILPLGGYGVFMASSTEIDAYDDVDVALAEVLAAHAETALGRIERERELERQNERLDQFASVVSHDLRNPLNVAVGALELVREECDSEHIDTVARAHERMEALIADLLVLAREGDAAESPETVALADAIETCWETVPTANATLDVETDLTIRADPARLRQLLENLLGNAVEHGGEGVTVRVGDLEGGFYVEDDGPGIPPGAREDVLRSGYTTGESGTGFGLAIVARVAEAHGWSVAVTESKAGGARFEFTGVDVVA